MGINKNCLQIVYSNKHQVIICHHMEVVNKCCPLHKFYLRDVVKCLLLWIKLNPAAATKCLICVNIIASFFEQMDYAIDQTGANRISALNLRYIYP